MKLYKYSPETKEYIGECVARLSPEDLKKGKTIFLVPANTTELRPPLAKTGEAAVFENGVWVIKLDNRGTEYFIRSTGEKARITSIGQEVPAEAVMSYEQTDPLKNKLKVINDKKTAQDAAWQEFDNAQDIAGVKQALYKILNRESKKV